MGHPKHSFSFICPYMMKTGPFSNWPCWYPYIEILYLGNDISILPNNSAFVCEKPELKSFNRSEMRAKRKVGPITFLP